MARPGSKEDKLIKLLTTEDGEYWTVEEIIEKTGMSKNSLEFYLKRDYLKKRKGLKCNVLISQKNSQIAYRLEFEDAS